MNKILQNNNAYYRVRENCVSQKGATAIFLTLIILMAMLFVALTASDIIQNGIQMNGAHLNSAKAYYAAESGTERILWEIRKSGPPALNPTTATSPAWTSGSCIRFTGANIHGCTLNCITGFPHQNQLTQELSNESTYKIMYEYDNVNNTATFTTTGNYLDMTKRVVQTRYVF